MPASRSARARAKSKAVPGAWLVTSLLCTTTDLSIWGRAPARSSSPSMPG